MNPDDVISALQEAKELVAVGWVNRAPTFGNVEEVCVQTALQRACGSFPSLTSNRFVACQRALVATLGHHHPTSGTPGVAIPMHNDHCLNTTGDALDWLDRAIQRVKNEAVQLDLDLEKEEEVDA